MLPPGAAPRDASIQPAEQQTSRTYRLDSENGRIAGTIDGVEAVKQSVQRILSTQRGQHAIYSRNYGIDLNGIIGAEPGAVESILKQRITEALIYSDDRIKSVADFAFAFDGDSASVEFTVVSTAGSFKSSYGSSQ